MSWREKGSAGAGSQNAAGDPKLPPSGRQFCFSRAKPRGIKERFYPAASAHYELARPGTMRLMPPDDCLFDLRADYEHMKNMIFGEKPEFREILSELEKLEDEINSLAEMG